MIHVLNAHTYEPDDVESAVADVLEQLDMENRLLKNSVGLMSFYSDFIETGAAKAICDALPFDVIGGTTSNGAVPGAMGDIMLSLSVLTSEDVSFAAGVSRPINGNADEAVKELYARLISGAVSKPSLLFTIAPVIYDVGGDDIVEAIDKASGGTPLFGSLAFTHLPDFSGIRTWCNGESHQDALTMIAVLGDASPKFSVTSIPDDRIAHKTAVITSAVKNRIRAINGTPLLEYLESISLAQDGNIAGISAVPFVITLADGSQVARSAYMLTKEGDLLSYGDTPEGSTIGFARCDAQFVTESTRDTLSRFLADSRAQNALLFSCAARRWTLGTKIDAEMKEIASLMDDSYKYQFAYSGGEICPVRNATGKLVNRFHNYTLIACLF
jgi:hypothetical protein